MIFYRNGKNNGVDFIIIYVIININSFIAISTKLKGVILVKPIRLNIDKRSLRILQLGVPFVIAALIYAALYLFCSESGSYYIIMNIGKQIVEHAMMTLTLLVGGALIFDYTIRKAEKEKR